MGDDIILRGVIILRYLGAVLCILVVNVLSYLLPMKQIWSKFQIIVSNLEETIDLDTDA